MAKREGHIRAGIGGWSYEPWRETFYPPGLAKAKELAHASRQVTTIEINATYYRTQSPQSFRRWAAETPDDFVFSVKANRFTTSRRNLADGRDSITHFLESGITELGPKLGPILWQLAPTKKFDASEIDDFLATLPKRQDDTALRHVLEVRHATFQSAEFVALARKHAVAICLALSDDYPLIADPTASFCYLRLQTTSAEVTNGYDAETIAMWVARLRVLAGGAVPDDLPLLGDIPKTEPRDCFVYMISGAKERNPAAARALIDALAA